MAEPDQDTPATGEGAPPEGSAPVTPEWASSIEDADLKGYVTSKGYASLADALKAGRDAETSAAEAAKASPGALKIPKDGVKDASWEGFKALGLPEKPEDYKITRPTMPEGLEYNEPMEKAMLPEMHKLAILPWQVQGVIDAVAKFDVAVAQAARAEAQKLRDGLGREMGDKWAGDKAKKTELAKRGAKDIGFDAGMVDHMEQWVGSFQLMEAFARLGALLEENPLATGAATRGQKSTADVLYGESSKTG